MNKLIAVVLGVLALIFVLALLQPQWNPVTQILLACLALLTAWQSGKFWKKAG